ncbi:MAG: hypothetical protein JOY99_13505 [Sphingomonadaceae bacterium]|nr:hypothetical protein [Sphingomonadaceae bacterium]
MNGANWGTPGKLLRAGVENPAGLRGAPVKEGPLGLLVRQVMSEPSAEHWRYSIVMQGRPLLGAVDIRLLAARPDYPQS